MHVCNDSFGGGSVNYGSYEHIKGRILASNGDSANSVSNCKRKDIEQCERKDRERYDNKYDINSTVRENRNSIWDKSELKPSAKAAQEQAQTFDPNNLTDAQKEILEILQGHKQ